MLFKAFYHSKAAKAIFPSFKFIIWVHWRETNLMNFLLNKIGESRVWTQEPLVMSWCFTLAPILLFNRVSDFLKPLFCEMLNSTDQSWAFGQDSKKQWLFNPSSGQEGSREQGQAADRRQGHEGPGWASAGEEHLDHPDRSLVRPGNSWRCD